jgi:hypothetical protein
VVVREVDGHLVAVGGHGRVELGFLEHARKCSRWRPGLQL